MVESLVRRAVLLHDVDESVPGELTCHPGDKAVRSGDVAGHDEVADDQPPHRNPPAVGLKHSHLSVHFLDDGGGQVRVRIPGRATCPVCGGGGGTGRYECWQCTGTGAVAADYPVEVPFPPGIRDGYATRISLRRFGIENFYLIVLFRVGGAGFAEPWNPESPP